MDTNPYQPPSGEDGGATSPEFVSERIVSILMETRPWVRFFSVLGFLLTGIMVLISVVGLVASVFMRGGGGEAMLLLVYLPVAMLYFFPSLHLWRYGSRIAEFAAHPNAQALEQALVAQRSFWRLIGIITATVVAIYVVIMIIGGVMGLASL